MRRVKNYLCERHVIMLSSFYTLIKKYINICTSHYYDTCIRNLLIYLYCGIQVYTWCEKSCIKYRSETSGDYNATFPIKVIWWRDLSKRPSVICSKNCMSLFPPHLIDSPSWTMAEAFQKSPLFQKQLAKRNSGLRICHEYISYSSDLSGSAQAIPCHKKILAQGFTVIYALAQLQRFMIGNRFF